MFGGDDCCDFTSECETSFAMIELKTKCFFFFSKTRDETWFLSCSTQFIGGIFVVVKIQTCVTVFTDTRV